MKKWLSSLVSISLIFIILGLLLSACSKTSPTTSGSPGVSTSAPLDGKTLMQERCTVCHTTDRITSKSATTEQWTTTVDRMIGKGAQLNSTERQTLIDYLAQTYP